MYRYHSHYETLKVARDAPIEVIRAAYRSLAQKHHPGRNPGHEAAQMMTALNKAYEALSDEGKRRKYDTDIAECEAMMEKWARNYEMGKNYRPQTPPNPPPATKSKRSFEVDWAVVDATLMQKRHQYGAFSRDSLWGMTKAFAAIAAFVLIAHYV